MSTYGRANHRARAHQAAHENEEEIAEPSHGHPLAPKGPAALIKTAGDLAALIAELRAAGSFAFDTEFIGELTYHPKLCLIQVATTQRVTLIDPLANLDLTPVWELLADPAVEKIVHAGQQDIEPVCRHLGRPAANVFDTQIAAGFISLPYPLSLSKLIGELTGIKLGKGLTVTNWDQRPLSSQQLRYAADDVRYLLAARAEMATRLNAAGHAAWAKEECDAQCQPGLYQFDPETAIHRVRGAGSLKARNLGVLRELIRWRDEIARRQNVPPRSLLRDEVLCDLSRSPVRNIEKLGKVRGLPRPVEKNHGAELLQATERGLALPAEALPHARNESELAPPHRFQSDALWAAAQAICVGRGIDTALAVTRQEMGEFFREQILGESGTTSHLMTGWRREVLGEPLKKLITGQLALTLEWKNGLRFR